MHIEMFFVVILFTFSLLQISQQRSRSQMKILQRAAGAKFCGQCICQGFSQRPIGEIRKHSPLVDAVLFVSETQFFKQFHA